MFCACIEERLRVNRYEGFGLKIGKSLFTSPISLRAQKKAKSPAPPGDFLPNSKTNQFLTLSARSAGCLPSAFLMGLSFGRMHQFTPVPDFKVDIGLFIPHQVFVVLFIPFQLKITEGIGGGAAQMFIPGQDIAVEGAKGVIGQGNALLVHHSSLQEIISTLLNQARSIGALGKLYMFSQSRGVFVPVQ